MSRGHNQRNEAVRSATRLGALKQKQDKSLFVWGSVAHLQPLTAGWCRRQEESESCGPQLVQLEMLFILDDFTMPSTHGLSIGVGGAMVMGILVPLLLLRADQLLDPVPVLVKSPSLSSHIC